MKRREPQRTGTVAVLAAALAAVSLMAASEFSSRAGAQTPAFHGLAGANPPLLIEVRHRLRHHRRSHRASAKREEFAPPGPAELESKSSVQGLQPPAGPAAMEPAKEATGAAPEPMGPPPPERWTAAEVEAGRMDCARLLSGVHALFETLEPIKEGACGTPAPIRLLGFENGREPKLVFSPPPTTSCKMAEALGRWAGAVLQPYATAHLGGPIVQIGTLSSYNCRSRYDGPVQRISEHAYANAVDIGEFITAKGEHIGVLDHWNGSGERSAFLHAIHDGACEIFGTTLGPDANASHKNHFHLDMKERRRPLCDFTPEQLRAREEAKKRAPANVP
ncbi:MAG: extensin family protein [Rhodomicrobium sp.]